ncbi:MAG TPA: hypothetical protein VMX58_04845 [Patescibacteria group bacterium]|nr:hypothetical protein [Patescibacteria group bacterium]
MRSLCEFSRYLCLAALLPLLSCAAAPKHETAPGMRMLDGDVTITGGGPIDGKIQLTTDNGESWFLESLPLEGELLGLDGHRIRVWGGVEHVVTASAVLRVDRYEMLPVDGMSPIIGAIGIDGSRVVFSAQKTGERYGLVGPLRGALCNFPGCKAWVWGVTVDDDDPGGEKIIEVKGYGILGPARDATGSVPQDTLRN